MSADHHNGLIDTNIVILRDWVAADVLPDEVAISAVTPAELPAGPHAVQGDDVEAPIERARRLRSCRGSRASSSRGPSTPSPPACTDR
jgi:hypothetical protein